jgi:CHAD domain-containing protein
MSRGRGITGRGSPPKEAAAAVAVAGAAAVGGKLAWDRLSGGGTDEASRAYRLRRDEYVPDGIRRVARGQLDDAQDELDGASKRKLGEAVHETRKRLKRLRAALRLARGALGEETYQRENGAFREAGRRLAGARDAKVLIETLDALTDRFEVELSGEATAPVRAQLDDEHKRAIAALREDEDAVGVVVTELRAARERVAAWTFESDGFGALEPGLRRVYRRGRRRMRAAEAEPSTENLHEWRKRVKDLWHAAQILRPAAPKRMRRLAREAHDLSDRLGDDHDLVVLREYAEAHPEAFEDEASRGALIAVIDRRRLALQQEAFALARKVYGPPPKRFVGSIERGWHKRASAQPQPTAG